MVETKRYNGELYEFIESLNRLSIRKVRIRSESYAGSSIQGHFTILKPKRRIIVSAFDFNTNTVHLWEYDVELGGPLLAPEASRVFKKNEIREALEISGFEVDEGQWSPENVEDILKKFKIHKT